MSLSALEISHVLGELSDALVGRRIRRIHQQDRHTLLLRTKRSILCVSCHPRACRLHLMDSLPEREGARDFCMVLRRRVEGRRIAELDQPDGDRCVRLRFEERQVGTPELVLCAELTGRHANLLLLQGETILGSLLPNRSSKRELSVGQPYVGLVSRSTIHTAPSRFPDLQPSSAITAHYQPLLEAWKLDDLRRTLTTPLQRKLRSARRLVRNLGRDRQSHEAKLAGQRFGDLILAQLAQVQKRSTSVTLPDLFFDGEGPPPQVVIDLDPRLSPTDNAQRYYRRATKARRGIAALDTRIPEITAEVTQVAAALQTLATADGATLERLATESAPKELPLKERRKHRKKGSAKRLPYLSFEASGKEPILVGRSAADNDRLTFSVARGRDVWLHARDVTGSHVVLRLEGGADPPHESLVDAACLAKHYSDARKSAHADITWTLRKHVRGSGTAGRVYVAQGHTLRVSEDPSRLRRLQEGRSETARLLQGLAQDRDTD
jgi:predicted ribosome quality control (RQC) complex YloA/Tae2 family protein